MELDILTVTTIRKSGRIKKAVDLMRLDEMPMGTDLLREVAKKFLDKQPYPLNDYINEGTINSIYVEGKYSIHEDVNTAHLLAFEADGVHNQDSHTVTLQRLVRDSKRAKELKKTYNRCQVCRKALRGANGRLLLEAHHIRPYNRTHQGDDNIRNLIVLCPSCHEQFDDLYYAIHPTSLLIHCSDDTDRRHLRKIADFQHTLGEEYLTYNWQRFVQKNMR